MGFLFNRPAPRQAVPRDLQGARQQYIDFLFGGGGGFGGGTAGRQMGSTLRGGGPAGQSQNLMGNMLRLFDDPMATAQANVLNPLAAQFRQNLDYGMSQINASSPGRFSTANNYMQGQLTQRAANDYNVLAGQILQQMLESGLNRQAQVGMGMLGPALSPMFGGPFTQGASPWENILGGVGAVAGAGGLGIPGFIFNASGGMRGNL